MDVFDYLLDDNNRIVHRLTDTAKNYSEWTRDRVFEESKKVFASIKDHFSRDTVLENNLKNRTDVEDILNKGKKLRDLITTDIEQIVEIHVDEPGFEQSLETIARTYQQYAKYCQDSFYPAMKKNLSSEDLEKVNAQIEQKILS